MKKRWWNNSELHALFEHVPERGLLVGETPSELGKPEDAFRFLDTVANLATGRLKPSPDLALFWEGIERRYMDGTIQTLQDAEQQRNALFLQEALRLTFGQETPLPYANIVYRGKVNVLGRKQIIRLDINGKPYALKVFTGPGAPLGSFRTWKFFEGQGVYNSLRVFCCNAGKGTVYTASKYSTETNVPWVLSEWVSPDTVNQAGRGKRKITEIAKQFEIDLQNPDANDPLGVDAVHQIAVDGETIKSLADILEYQKILANDDLENFRARESEARGEYERNLAAWEAEGF